MQHDGAPAGQRDAPRPWRQRGDPGHRRHQGADALRAADRQPGVLGDGRARRHHRRDDRPAAGRFCEPRQFLQHHPQLRLHRHDGRRHDGGHHHRRHRPVGRLHHGARRRGLRHPAAGGLAVVGRADRRPADRHGDRRRERGADRLCGPVAVRGDARHALLRPLRGDRAVAEQDDLRVRSLRRDVQISAAASSWGSRIRSGC